MPGKSKKQIANWFDEDTVDAPRTDLDMDGTIQRRSRFIRIAIYISAICGALALVAVVADLAQPASKAAQSSNQTTATSPGKTTAMTAVEDWLNSDPAPVPGGQLLSWDGYTKVPFPKVSEEKKESGDYEPPTYRVEVHHMTVVSSTGQTFKADVEVAIDKKAGPQAISSPSLVPITPSASDFQADSPWPGMPVTGDAPAAVKSAIGSWVKAYTSGSPQSLRLAVGDGDSRHAYVPMTGVKDAKYTVPDVAWYQKTNDDGDKVNGNRLLARVDLTVTWDGQEDPDDSTTTSDDDSTDPVISIDVLVENANTAAPRVVAWGGPGTGKSLKKFSNAVTGRDISGVNKPGDQATAPPTQSPSPTSPPPATDENTTPTKPKPDSSKSSSKHSTSKKPTKHHKSKKSNKKKKKGDK